MWGVLWLSYWVTLTDSISPCFWHPFLRWLEPLQCKSPHVSMLCPLSCSWRQQWPVPSYSQKWSSPRYGRPFLLCSYRLNALCSHCELMVTAFLSPGHICSSSFSLKGLLAMCCPSFHSFLPGLRRGSWISKCYLKKQKKKTVSFSPS